MHMYLPLVGRLKVKPIFAVRSSERVLLRFGTLAVTLLTKEKMRKRVARNPRL